VRWGGWRYRWLRPGLWASARAHGARPLRGQLGAGCGVDAGARGAEDAGMETGEGWRFVHDTRPPRHRRPESLVAGELHVGGAEGAARERRPSAGAAMHADA
jgi:hypothetical protein